MTGLATETGNKAHALDNGGLARVYVFSRRLPMMHRDGWEGPRATSATDFAWFIWQRGHNTLPKIRRVDWKDYA